MRQENGIENRRGSVEFFGTKHAAACADVDPTTARDYVKRGIVTPQKTSTGRLLWTMADVAKISAYASRPKGGMADDE
jgi:predicted site-specific integrase-resolvase